MKLLPGAILCQRYRVDALLGEGGMGAVYCATDWYTGMQVALKVMRPEWLQDADMLRRFHQEANIGMYLRHPNIRQVYDAGVDDYSRCPFLAMELLWGEDLATRLSSRGFLPPAEVEWLFAQICDALATAHASGVVHRDLKPENLFLAAHPAGETIKILDFGIAKVMAGGAAPQSSMVIGTPVWMAPEQLGTGSDIGPWTDVWALGLLVFLSLTGQSYWTAANTASPSFAHVLTEVLDLSQRVTASARAAQFGFPDRILPGGFDEWFAGCVARDARSRFRDVPTAWASLQRALRSMAAGASRARHVASVTAPMLDDEDGVVDRSIAELTSRVPAALAAAEQASISSRELSSGSRPKIPLVKGTPTPAPVSIHTPRPPPSHHGTPPPGAIVSVLPASVAVWAEPASKGRRVGANAIDRVSAFVAAVAMVAAVDDIANLSTSDRVSFFCFMFFLLYVLRDLLGGGRSLGKRVFGLRIVNLGDGAPAGVLRTLARQLFSLDGIPFIGLAAGLIDSLLVLARDDGRRSGDLLFGTAVIQSRTSVVIP